MPTTGSWGATRFCFEKLADLANVQAGQRALDVGCGPGALTGELILRLGHEPVSAVDPSEPFVAAVRERYPGVDVHRASGEELSFPDESFDATLAQLVVHFMKDPVLGLGEMRRVTRRDGVVATCVRDHGGDQGPRPVLGGSAPTRPRGGRRIAASRCPGGRSG